MISPASSAMTSAATSETKNGERVREPGVLEEYTLTAEQTDALVLNARVAAGWIEALPEPEPEPKLKETPTMSPASSQIEAKPARRERERRCIVSGRR